MVKAKPSYEEIRQQRLEENKKRMEDLNLTQLALSLRDTPSKPSPIKNFKPRTPRRQPEFVQVRRSIRVANKPAPVYQEEVPIKVLERSRRYYKPRWDLLNRVYASVESRENAIERAEELQSSLEHEFPCFVKSMLQSHVTGGFWLGLPAHFCRRNLPKRDETITLVDENGEEYPTVYLPRKTGLSGGWKGFSVAHDLVDGDALVFQLVKPTQFKVYIIRAE